MVTRLLCRAGIRDTRGTSRGWDAPGGHHSLCVCSRETYAYNTPRSNLRSSRPPVATKRRLVKMTSRSFSLLACALSVSFLRDMVFFLPATRCVGCTPFLYLRAIGKTESRKCARSLAAARPARRVRSKLHGTRVFLVRRVPRERNTWRSLYISARRKRPVHTAAGGPRRRRVRLFSFLGRRHQNRPRLKTERE